MLNPQQLCGVLNIGDAGCWTQTPLLSPQVFPCHLRKHLITEEELSMTNSIRVTKIGFLVFGALLLASATWAQNCPPAAERIAKAYGLEARFWPAVAVVTTISNRPRTDPYVRLYSALDEERRPLRKFRCE